MRIAIDARTICDAGGGPGAGIEHYTWSTIFTLVRRYPRDRFLIFVPSALPADRCLELLAGCRNAQLLAVPSKPPVIGRHVLMPLIAFAWRAEALWCPTPHLPAWWPGASVVTVHDLAIFAHPEWFPNGDATSVSTKRLVPRALRRAARIVAVSQFAARQVEGVVPGAFGKVDVVHPGVTVPSQVTGTARFDLPGEFVLCLGTIEPRKNLVGAIQAFDRFLSAHPERVERLRLVLAGKWGWKTEEVRAVLDETNAAWNHLAPDGIVHALGPVTEDEKWELLSRASALFMPSFEEGFGLPALEAMALGIPVICSNHGALPEVVGDTGLLCSPDDGEEMALLLAQVLLMPEAIAEIAESGIAQAAQFTWEGTADGVRAAIEKAVQKK